MGWRAYDEWRERALKDFMKALDDWKRTDPSDSIEWGRHLGIDEAARRLDYSQGRADNWHKNVFGLTVRERYR